MSANESASSQSDLYPAPVPLTPEVHAEIWANLFGGFERAGRVEVSEEERELIIQALEEQGVRREDISFVGANVFVEDVSFNAEPMLEHLRSKEVEKGKVVNQIITSIIGQNDTSLISPAAVQGIPVQYASQEVDNAFLFNRPEVDAGFAHVIVVPNATPARIVTEFRNSVAAIGNAANTDCLDATFLEVMTRADFDERFADRPFDIPPRVTEVVYAPAVCGNNALGCSQFPRIENVVLAPASPFPGGGGGITQRRFRFGGYVGIDSNQVTPTSADFSTITHELMHAIGIAHPQPDEFRVGGAVSKLVVPGTDPDDSGYPSIMALRGTADRVLVLSNDDIDTIRTLYDDSPGCSYQTEALPILPI